MTIETTIRMLLGAVVFCAASAATANDWPLDYYDEAAGRLWERIDVPQAACGGGTPFHFFYSQASRSEGETRLVVYLEGGSSTKPNLEGGVSTPIDDLPTLVDRLTPPAAYTGRKAIFMDRPENDEFIGAAHWVFIPYCTQDSHRGRRLAANHYDFLGTGVETDVESALALGVTVEEIEASAPGLSIDGVRVDDEGSPDVTRLTLSITHCGRSNLEATLATLQRELRARTPSFFDAPEILWTGGSAGGRGAFASFQLAGDAFAQSGARLTLAPMASAFITRLYDAEQDVLVPRPDADELAAIVRKAWAVVLPCEIAGGQHVPSTDDRCDDMIDLLDHYRVQRYPNADVRYAPMLNKEDGFAIDHAPPGDREAQVRILCQTTHRYGQNLLERPDTHPWFPWQALAGGPRIHIPSQAALLTAMQSPAGDGLPSPWNLLGFLNAVASRGTLGDFDHIEFLPNTIDSIDDPESDVTTHPDHLPECNVPWPLR